MKMISNLEGIHGSLFIVRVIIEDKGTRVSGLASAQSVEEAEELALKRAYTTLESLIQKEQKQPQVTPEPEPKAKSNGKGNRKTKAKPQPEPEPESESEPELESELEPEHDDDDDWPEPESEQPPSQPLSFEEIIEQTNVELKRLSWGSNEGKEYLLKTYGKRSRQLLTDEELIDFLSQLKKMPTPV
jgi:hypothetical protein